MHRIEEDLAEAVEPVEDQTERTVAESAGRRTMRVMVAFDASECSRYALSWALENLLSSDTHVIIFSAQPLLEFSYVFATPTYTTTRTAP